MRMAYIFIGLLLPFVCSAQVVISEVRWAGSDISSADEWLRISCYYGEGIEEIEGEEGIEDKCPVDISGWKLLSRKGSGEDAVIVEFPEGTIIGNTFLISNYQADRSALDEEPDLVTTSVSLPNSKLFLQLIDGSGSVIDSVDDGVGAPFAGGKNPYLSMVRIDLGEPGTEKGNWREEEREGEEGEEGIKGIEEGEEKRSSSFSSMPSQSSTPSTPLIIISEVLASPIGSDDYEWIEIANLGESAVDISGWVLSDGSRSHTIPPRNASGYLLLPGEHTLFFHHQTGIALGSNGELITLSSPDTEIDRLDVSATGEEISFGREADGSRGSFCVPTPRLPNEEPILNPKIILQSGRATDYVKVTLNLNVEVEEGSLKDAECHWDFKDGTSSKKCNPPSHTWDYYGVYNVELTVMTKCGEEIKRKLDVVVLEKRTPMSSRFISSKKGSKTSKSLRSLSVSKIPIYRSSNSSIEQIIYTTSSSSQAQALPIRYRNITSQAPVITSSPDIYNQVYKLTDPKYHVSAQNKDSGMPWILLFSQSAILVGIKAFRVID